MRLLIVSTKHRLAGYFDFVEALASLGAEAVCVHDLKYCFLCESKPLHVVPVPKLLKLVKQFNPDFIMTDSPYYVPYLGKLINRRVLFHMRGDVWSEAFLDRAYYPSLFTRVYSHYLAKVNTPGVKKADLVLPNCKWLQRKVEQRLPNHLTEVLYVGIDAEEWVSNQSVASDVKHPMVVGVFPFTIYAKVTGLLKFTRVAKEMPDVTFYFAGDGPYLNMAKKKCPPNMLLIGKLSRSEVKKLLESGDIFVHPSGSDALPRSVKEASLLEKPVVASNVGGIPEIVENNQSGYLCNINDVGEWVGKIRFLLDNPNVARRFGENARKFVAETFNWRNIADNFLRDLKTFENEDLHNTLH
jgi:glycosyltransferase involved in cell wall biosynthesis